VRGHAISVYEGVPIRDFTMRGKGRLVLRGGNVSVADVENPIVVIAENIHRTGPPRLVCRKAAIVGGNCHTQISPTSVKHIP
jgi:hypothetical protein